MLAHFMCFELVESQVLVNHKPETIPTLPFLLQHIAFHDHLSLTSVQLQVGREREGEKGMKEGGRGRREGGREGEGEKERVKSRQGI